MNFFQSLYVFFNEHVTWNFGPAINKELSDIWHKIGALLFFPF